MTKDDKNKLLHEALGWTKTEECLSIDPKNTETTVFWISPEGTRFYGRPFDFFDEFYGLGPCHQLEKKLEDEVARERYRINLNTICGYGKAWKDSECDDDIVFASAAQRAEALGWTLDLWRNGE